MTCLGEIFYPKGLNLLQKSEIKKKSQFLLKSARKSFLFCERSKIQFAVSSLTIPVHHTPLPQSKGRGWGWVGNGS